MIVGAGSLCTDASSPGGGAGTTSELGPNGEMVYGSVVGDLPRDVSVVVYSYADTGEVIGWQTPVAYASYVPMQQPADTHRDITWEFYDADGQRLGTFGIQP